MKRTRNVSLACFVFCLLAHFTLTGCGRLGFGYIKIGDLLRNTNQYAGKEVKIKGRVTDVVKVPFLELKMYTVRDDTGEILVLTSTIPPVTGTEVRVKGALNVLATLGDKSIGVHLRESQRW